MFWAENAEASGVPDGSLTASNRATDKSARDAWIRALQATASLTPGSTLTLPALIEQIAQSSPSAVALIGEAQTLTYAELAAKVSYYAGWALQQDVGHGDTVCLLMRNCPEYLAVWLGITRVGGVVSLLNTHLTGDALRHAIATVSPKHVIAGAELVEAVDAVSTGVAPDLSIWVHGDDQPSHRRIDSETGMLRDDDALSASLPVTLADRALYIYTSGTTGMPKAANVSHFRLMQWSRWFAGMMGAGPSDRMYNCLPMYHSVGGVVAPGAMLVSGGSVVIRERFSASRFWADIVSSESTVFQYIGELCRYLVNSPPHSKETAHRLRLSCGNGLRPDVWGEFRRRFNIPRNLEFYAATEANFSLYNCEGEPGSIGRIPPFLAHRFPVVLVKFDVETGEPIRNEAGFCVRCEPDEVGEAISKIATADAKGGAPFEGYTDQNASAKKVLRDVFAPGDAWFRSGDLMRKDARGFYYFIDRVGDTFRWKGENVSTTAVAEVISSCPGVNEAVVYGVAVPGTDGGAGMATIVTRPEFDFTVLRQHLAASVPEYARPLFVRVRDTIDLTVTFKQKKQDLVREGYDPRVTTDAIYFDDRAKGMFVPIDAALHRRIEAGLIRL
jgi:fatty-acyl-CoA synthase